MEAGNSKERMMATWDKYTINGVLELLRVALHEASRRAHNAQHSGRHSACPERECREDRELQQKARGVSIALDEVAKLGGRHG